MKKLIMLVVLAAFVLSGSKLEDKNQYQHQHQRQIQDEKIVVNPPGDTRLDEGHILYVLGNNAQIEKLQELAK